MSRDALFDLAVARALRYAVRLGIDPQDEGVLTTRLQPWYLRTRFAYRVPLGPLIRALTRYPGKGYHWTGGEAGGWHRERRG